MCYNMDAKNNTGSAVLAVEPCLFVNCGNRSGPALQFFPYTGRRKALTCLPEAEKHIEVVVVFYERVLHNVVFRSVRGEVFKPTEVQNPIHDGLVNPQLDCRLHGFQRFRVVSCVQIVYGDGNDYITEYREYKGEEIPFSEPVPDLLDFVDRLESLCPDEFHPDEVIIYET